MIRGRFEERERGEREREFLNKKFLALQNFSIWSVLRTLKYTYSKNNKCPNKHFITHHSEISQNTSKLISQVQGVKEESLYSKLTITVLCPRTYLSLVLFFPVFQKYIDIHSIYTSIMKTE